MDVASDETPKDGSREGFPAEREPMQGLEHDALAERRARRDAGQGEAGRGASADPILVRRAESAEAAAHALEDRLSTLQGKLREAEQECATATERLGQRELDLQRASERLAGGELQLRAVSARLVDTEQELSAVSKRLGDREQELHGVSRRLADREHALEQVSKRLGEREHELQSTEREVEARLTAIESRVEALRGEVVSEHEARLRAEAELTQLRDAHAGLARIVAELRSVAARLRAEIEAEHQPSEQQQAQPEMAAALAAAVARLRARVVAAQDDSEDPTPPESIAYVPALASAASKRPLWIGDAIRSIATRHMQRLAGELVLELLAARAAMAARPLRFGLSIEALGAFDLLADDGNVTVLAADASEHGRRRARRLDFLLEGPPAAFAQLAGGEEGGKSLRRGERPRVRAGKRRWKRFRAACRPPLALGDVVGAGRTVWPGLLLLALCELVDPAWLEGDSLSVDFALDAPAPATLRVQAAAGGPLQVSRVPAAGQDETAAGQDEATAAGQDEATAAGHDQARAAHDQAGATVRLSERAFNCMISGRGLPEGEQVSIDGDVTALARLLTLTDRVQGIRRSDA